MFHRIIEYSIGYGKEMAVLIWGILECVVGEIEDTR
jgi:hypothetical protein